MSERPAGVVAGRRLARVWDVFEGESNGPWVKQSAQGCPSREA